MVSLCFFCKMDIMYCVAINLKLKFMFNCPVKYQKTRKYGINCSFSPHLPTNTLTHDSHSFTCKNELKNMENGGEMGEIDLVLMIFMNLLHLIQFSTKKHVLGHILKVPKRIMVT